MLKGEQAEVLGEHRLADAAGAPKQDVVSFGDEVERGELFDAVAREDAGVVPVEEIEGLEGAEVAALVRAVRVSLVALAAGDGEQVLERLHGERRAVVAWRRRQQGLA